MDAITWVGILDSIRNLEQDVRSIGLEDLDDDLLKIINKIGNRIAVENGGTGADNAADARVNLGINYENLGIVPIALGGTGANNAASARANLGINYANLGVVPAVSGGTGSTNLRDAYTAMHEMTILTTGEDLNDIKKPGVYAAAGTVTETIQHRPRDGGFTLFVFANSELERVTQLWVLNGNTPVWILRNYNTNGIWTDWVWMNGTADEAVKLQTARTIRTNLGSTSAPGFDGTANIAPGITGTLAVSHGGTGATDSEAALANLFATAPSMSPINGYSGRATFSGGYVQYGKLVIVNTTLTVASTLAAGNSVCGTGLPRTPEVVGLSAGIMGAKRTSAPVAVTVSVGGNLSLDRSGQLVAGDVVYISGVYFTT